jgi:D-alanyl-D-alanine endopeptidase (penicillin-binding protein 7)
MMQLHRVLRAGGAILTGLLLGCVTGTADVAAATPTSPVYSAASGGVRHSRRAVRRARRPPPGGCYARNAIVLDPATGQVLYEKNAGLSVPIASLTKLMTALVFLEQKPDLDRVVEVTRADLAGAGHTQLRNREHVALGDLFHMSLMCSDNVATRVLARESRLPPEDFLARMNQKAIELGLTHTRYVEFTGLDERNVSTAADVARLLRAAADNSFIQSVSTTRSYEFRSATRPHHVANTNRLLYGRYEILGGKTGFISEAGYCLATWIRTQGHDFIAVVLGAPTNATRFADVTRLVQRTLAANITPTQP